MNRYILLTTYLATSVSGLFMMKLGGALSFGLQDGGVSFNASFRSLLGILLYGCSFLQYIMLLPRFDLSFLIPVSSGVLYLLVVLFSHFVLREDISALQLTGVCLVLAGVIIMNMKAKS